MREKPSLLSALARPELSALAQSFTRHRLAEGELIYDSRLTGHDAVFVVVTGQMRVFLSSEGKEFTLFFLERDDVFTFHSGAVLEARKPTDILSVDVTTFDQILMAVPSLALTVIPLMGRTLRNTIRIIEDLSFRDVRQRLMRLLCDAAENAGRPVAEGILIETDMHAEDFAMMTGTTRQSVSTVFTELVRNDLIRRPSRTQVIIPDLARLKKAIQLH